MPRQPLGKVGSPGGYSLPCCRSSTRTHTSVKHSCQALISPLRIVPRICAMYMCVRSAGQMTWVAEQARHMQGITPATTQGRDGAQSGAREAALRLPSLGQARSGSSAQPCEAHHLLSALALPRRRSGASAGPSAGPNTTCSEQSISAPPTKRLLVHLKSISCQ